MFNTPDIFTETFESTKALHPSYKATGRYSDTNDDRRKDWDEPSPAENKYALILNFGPNDGRFSRSVSRSSSAFADMGYDASNLLIYSGKDTTKGLYSVPSKPLTKDNLEGIFYDLAQQMNDSGSSSLFLYVTGLSGKFKNQAYFRTEQANPFSYSGYRMQPDDLQNMLKPLNALYTVALFDGHFSGTFTQKVKGNENVVSIATAQNELSLPQIGRSKYRFKEYFSSPFIPYFFDELLGKPIDSSEMSEVKLVDPTLFNCFENASLSAQTLSQATLFNSTRIIHYEDVNPRHLIIKSHLFAKGSAKSKT